jgi:hypothetical protein
MLYKPALCLAVVLCLAVTVAHAQSVDSLTGKLANFPTRLFSKITGKTANLQRQLTRQTKRYLHRMARQEEKLKARLYKTDSIKAAALYPQDPKQQYAAVLQKFKQDSSRVFTSMGPEYLARVDSLEGALGFLNKNPGVLNANPAMQAKMQGSLASVQQLQAKLQATDAIKQFIQSRKAQIQQALSGYTHLPSGIANAVADYKKQAYYYADQVRQYRSELNDPEKMMQTALVLLNKLPAFASFMRSNSFLAGMFSVPGNYGSSQGLEGMQTRDHVLAMIQNRIGSGGSGGTAALQSSLHSASQDISKIQNKISSMGAGSENMDMPGFKPNSQKTKSFLKRLNYGINLQTQQSSVYFPTTTDIGLLLGYMITDKSTIGVGASYKIGWGTDFQHISLSSQGAGVRSFIDIQAIKSFYVSGGFEYNYQPTNGFFLKINNLDNWTKSGLVGISKVVSMKTKVFKSTKIQFLWDFLSYYQMPRQQPFKFRIGYSF